jgi:hypothetical protein
MLDNKIEINIVHGRDISGNAFFGSTLKMSESDKKDIRILLNDSNILSDLYDHLSFQGNFTKYDIVSEIDKTNLVTRFKSLPKKSFDFLRCGLKIDTNCKPFNLVSELSNKSKT